MNIVASLDSCATLEDMRNLPFRWKSLDGPISFEPTYFPESDEDFASAVRHGVSLAKGELAIGLPGFSSLAIKLKQESD
jgi:hypothetical protein